MMMALRAALLLAVGVLVLTLTAPTAAPTSIIVRNADVVRQVTTSRSAELEGSAVAVSPRVVLEHANQVRHVPMQTIPGALQSVLGQVPARLIFLYANTNRQLQMSYPVALINDQAPPQPGNISVRAVSGSAITITWTTNEFANSVLLYGSQPGQYTNQIVSPLYAKEHTVTITGLSSGATYYYRIRNTDLSGNIYESQEYSFVVQSPVYLPVVLRGRQ
jgi:hypothetical protein